MTAKKAAAKPSGRPSTNLTVPQQIRVKALEFAFRHNYPAPSEVKAEELTKVAGVYERYIAG